MSDLERRLRLIKVEGFEVTGEGYGNWLDTGKRTRSTDRWRTMVEPRVVRTSIRV